ncbi:MAG: cyclic nucleotide-binding domain-containing protein, partial [Bacteroidota bacterium]
MTPIEKLKVRLDQAQSPLWEKNLVLKRNEFLKVRGSIDTKLYYVVSGSIRAFIEDEYEEHTIRFGYQGSFILALDSFFTGQPSEFYLQAIKKTELQVMKRDIFLSFIHSDVENVRLWEQLKEILICQQLEREIDLLTHSPLERYRRVL